MLLVDAAGLIDRASWALQALRATVSDKKDGHQLDEAIDNFTEASKPAYWIDDTHLQAKKGEQVFENKEEGVQELEELAEKNSALAPRLQAFIAREVLSARILVEVVLPGANRKDLDQAQKELAKGDAKAACGKASEAIEHYKNAWKAVIQ